MQLHKRETPGNLVCKLNKAIYGLKTAPRWWQKKLRQALHTAGFNSFKYDNHVFRQNDTLTSNYVDDFMILAKSKAQIDKTTEILPKEFQIKNLGNVKNFLGISICQESDDICINQIDKIWNLCKDMEMQLCRGVTTIIAFRWQSNRLRNKLTLLWNWCQQISPRNRLALESC